MQVQLSTDSSNASSLWKFEKIDDQPANVKSVCVFAFIKCPLDLLISEHFSKPDPMKLFIATQVQRPTKFDSPIANTFAIIVPVSWLATITV